MIIEKNRYLIKTRVNIGHYFGGEPEEGFVELREPTTHELLGLQDGFRDAGDNQGERLRVLAGLLPAIVVDHSFYKDEKTKYTGAEFAEVILEKMDLFSEVITQYSEKVLFTLTPATTEPGKTEASGDAPIA